MRKSRALAGHRPTSGTIDHVLVDQPTRQDNHFVQQNVHHEGYCVSTPDQITTAFHERTRQRTSGKYPIAGQRP